MMDCKWRRRFELGVLVTAMVLAIIAATLPAVAQPGPRPARIVSLNLCTDQLLLAVADPAQVLALSRLARSDLSFLADRTSGVRTLSGGAEEVLALKPDLVLAGAFSGGETRAFLMRRGLRVETFAPVTSLAAAHAEIERFAALIGQSERGNALLAEIVRALEAARGIGHGLTAVAYERRGFAAGRGTLLDELMGHMGLINAAARTGLTSVAAMPLEAVIRARPDVLILDWGGAAPPDQGTALLLHPALDAAVPTNRRIVLPARLVACAGPALPVAIDTLAVDLRRIKSGLK